MVHIITDTTAGLPRDLTDRLGIPVLPQLVIFGEQTYRDDSELDTPTFLHKLRASAALPKTAAPPPANYQPIFEKLILDGETILCIHPSAKISGTVRSATVAAQDYPQADIRLFDSQTVAGNLGSMVLVAAEMARAGKSAEVIIAHLETLIARQRTYFLIDTLEYLQKGGRIGGARALLGELLQVKPILTLREGQVEPYAQERTKKRALLRLEEIVREECPRSPDSRLCVMQVEAQQAAEELAGRLKALTGLEQIPIYEIPPAIVVHAGPQALGIGFFTAPMV